MSIQRITLALIFLCISLVPCGQALKFLGEPETYAKFPKWDACDNATIMFDFKTSQPNGLLMYTDDSGRYDYLQVALQDGLIHLWINFVRNEEKSVSIKLGDGNLHDGTWHTVEVKRNRMETTLIVDETQQSQVAFEANYRIGDLDSKNYMYFGGIPSSFRGHAGANKLPESVLNTPYSGELRNILYFNCTCLPTR
ncbi:hypothetical protein EGW08_009476 [Elysia chlorotica]|uniref:Laminin G domain-containing protein n=1 Tax=Elysia chlorotica TaxID=188477 RepID=A0A3S1HN70_ELYCH|nr:hypothetical protein EGW08_009476 [Elysia chlorotica]